MARQAIAAVRGAFSTLVRTGVEPETAPPSLVAGLALVPPVVAGVLVFRVTALEMLLVALGAGLAAHVAARLIAQPLDGTPVLPAVVGVAAVGSGAALPWAGAVALVAAAFELGRARFAASARLQVGLIAYAVVLLLSRGGPAAYVSPDGVPASEPVRLLLQSPASGQVALDQVRLYVGNVAGPVFATSMLAVAVGVAWLWYSRRLSILVVLTFLAGAGVALALGRLPAGYLLTSGPLWFAAALVLADRRTLPASQVGRPLVGFLAGLLAMGAHVWGFSIEAALVAVAGVQLVTVGAQGLVWMRQNREETRARVREIREATVALAMGRVGRPRPAQPPS